MKKAIAYMMIGALAVTCAGLYMKNNPNISCKMTNLKKAGMETKDKVMSMF